MTFSPTDHQHMRRAIELAEQGRYTTHPNPRVGCVIAQGERILGEGSHRKAGEAHAEVIALRTAGESARGATAYVTLEPHSFHGKTPPCTDALIRAGIARVVCGVLDPNPKVSGEGIRLLAAAGITAEVGLLAEEARSLNLGFERRMTAGVPRVMVKIAASLDGRIALANGQSRWITGQEARADVQRLRAQSSAVLTGIETIRVDDPQLNVRDPALVLDGRQPVRVVLDSRLRIESSAKLFETSGPIIVVTCVPSSASETKLSRGLAEVVRTSPDSNGQVDLRELLVELGRRECNDVLIEAGPTLSSRFIAAGLCDELVVYQAPVFLGQDARPMLLTPLLQRLEDGLQFELRQVHRMGRDLKLTLLPRLN